VLTADHRLGAALAENESVELWLAPGERVAGTVEQRCDEADLALIRLYGDQLPSPEVSFDQARRGESWTAANGSRVLRGTVRRAATLRHGAPGLAPVEVMELDCDGTDDAQRATNRRTFAASAGSPVERAGASPFPVVLGIAVRLGHDGDRDRDRDTNLPMVAATVAELLDGVWPAPTAGQASAAAPDPLSAAVDPFGTAVDPFGIEELPEDSPVSYREKYQNQVMRRLDEYGVVTPVPVTNALRGDLPHPGGDPTRGPRSQ
jgi:hypothetical protein